MGKKACPSWSLRFSKGSSGSTDRGAQQKLDILAAVYQSARKAIKKVGLQAPCFSVRPDRLELKRRHSSVSQNHAWKAPARQHGKVSPNQPTIVTERDSHGFYLAEEPGDVKLDACRGLTPFWAGPCPRADKNRSAKQSCAIMDMCRYGIGRDRPQILVLRPFRGRLRPIEAPMGPQSASNGLEATSKPRSEADRGRSHSGTCP